MADLLVVSLGSTAGLREADDELAASIERAGLAVALVRARAPRQVRTLMLTDFLWARSARTAALEGIAKARPRAILYSSVTAALLWPRRGAIRFDALAAENRPGRHGVWQRPLERRRLAQASLLIPWSDGSLVGLRPSATRVVVLCVPVEPSGPAVPLAARDLAAITYAADPHKKGLDRVLAAWRSARREGEELVVVGAEQLPPSEGIRSLGLLPRAEYRALLRRSRIFLTAPRREDHGIAQIEALADGCMLVTTPAPGPYAALALARILDPRLVSDDLAPAIRAALDAPLADYSQRASSAVSVYKRERTDRIVSRGLVPALIAPA